MADNPAPTFGERFSFARWWQALAKGDETDAVFAEAVGRSNTMIGDYRQATKTPNSGVWVDAAERLGVDFQWLVGRKAEPPAGWPDRELFLQLFGRWLETARAQRELTVSVGKAPLVQEPPSRKAEADWKPVRVEAATRAVRERERKPAGPKRRTRGGR